MWNYDVIFPLYFILEGRETDFWNKLDYILHSYTAIVYLSPNKIYGMISSDNLVGKMEKYRLIIKEFVIYDENVPQMATGLTSAWKDISYSHRNLPIAEIKK